MTIVILKDLLCHPEDRSLSFRGTFFVILRNEVTKDLRKKPKKIQKKFGDSKNVRTFAVPLLKRAGFYTP